MTGYSIGTYLVGNRRKRKVQKRRMDKNKLHSRSLVNAKHMTNNSPYARVQRMRIPPVLVRRVENKLHTKFKQLPAFYVVYPKKGHKFKAHKKGTANCMAITDISLKSVIKDEYGRHSQPIKYEQYKPVITTYKAFMKSKHLRNVALIHELGEALASQNEIKWKATHGWATKLDREYMREHNLTEKQLSALTRKCFSDERYWK
jgi:hypothetical protein